MLKDNLSDSLIDAAEAMLRDFSLLLPELYGNFICTANMHLLSHLAKYVRMWGPLWTHSSFGFENKNGHLKHFFHGKTDFVDQILFIIDVCCTLQSVQKELCDIESPEVLRFTNSVVMPPSRSNMLSMGSHTYAVGKRLMKTLSLEESTAICHSGPIEVFYRLYKKNSMYYSTSYGKASDGKRDNTYCCYANGNEINFGCIELFALTPAPHVFIRKLQRAGKTLLNSGGNPCRPSLLQYKEVDLLDSYIVPVTSSKQLMAIPIERIISKDSQLYCIVLPNSLECH